MMDILGKSAKMQVRKQITRENLYPFAVGAVALDFGSTIIATLRHGSFAEFNPIAQAIGFPGTIVYGIAILSLVSLALLKWGVSWGRRRDKFYILIGGSFIFAVLVSFLINRRLLVH